jgi:anhydro-N-acetylmuramic acid kinase
VAQYIGLMSGTSLDGIDGVLVDLADDPDGIRVLAHRHQPFDPALRRELAALNQSVADELPRAALAANGVARAYASVTRALLHDALPQGSAVRALGAHGQTVRHRPGASDDVGYTIQLLNGALLAELTGIDVICDFRSRDLAAGGQGAPLAPAFHAAMFGDARETRAVLNLGGIANLTLLDPKRPVIGFDTGPANTLLDAWCERHRGEPFDADGAWAASGHANPTLLSALLAEPFFALSPPKSTGRDLFDLDWVDARIGAMPGLADADVQATLAALTVESVGDAIAQHAPQATRLYVCGGGARNSLLMRMLAARMPTLQIATTNALGVPVDQVEAVAFAWLARQFVERRTGNLPAVTGAGGSRLLGALYPA